MTTLEHDPGHLLPDEDWAAVVAEAEAELARITAGHPAAEAPAVRGRTTGLLPLAGQVTAPRNGGVRKRGWPTFGVLHDAETPLVAGYAAAMARYFRDKAPTSCHYMVDPAETWGVLNDALIAWHCGNGNPNSLAVEQAGYARFTRAQWTTPDGLRQMDRVATIMRAAKARYGIGTYWMTDQQLRDAHAGRIVGGWATHDQCRRVLGGTTHTDPMPNYPLDLLMARANGEDDNVDAAQEDRIAEKAANKVWTAWFTVTGGPDTGKKIPAGAGHRDTWQRVQSNMIQLTALRGELAGLRSTVDTLGKALAAATGQPLDTAALLAQVDATVRAALEDATVQVDVNVTGRQPVTFAMDELPDGAWPMPGLE